MNILSSPRLLPLCAALLAAIFLVPAPRAQERPGNGAITGRVLNSATQSYLRGAVVSVANGPSTVTDSEGRFDLTGLPPGDYTLVTSYTGLDTLETAVQVQGNQTASREISMTSSIYALTPFLVAGEREGSAQAIMLQRNSANYRNIVASDTFGTVADGNVGEFLKRLPGIFADGKNGESFSIRVRGMDSHLNSVTVDGFKLADVNQDGAGSRVFEIGLMPIEGIETLEVTKSPAPSQPADSIGGAVNVVTKSALDQKYTGPRGYLSGGVSLRNVRNEPSFNGRAGYTDVYSIFNGEKNLGVSFSVSLSDNYIPVERTIPDYEPTEAEPAYISNWAILDSRITRRRAGATLNFDYKASPTTTFRVRSVYNWYDQVSYEDSDRFDPVDRVVALNADGTPRTRQANDFFGQPMTVTVNSANQDAGILPGYTSELTRVTNARFAGSRYDYAKERKTYSLGFLGQHKLQSLSIDYGLAWGTSAGGRIDNQRGGGQYSWEVPNVGVDFTSTERDGQKIYRQTSGRDVRDPRNWNFVNNGVRWQKNRALQDTVTFNTDVKQAFQSSWLKDVQTGVRYAWAELSTFRRDEFFNYVGPDGRPNSGDERIDRFVDQARPPYRLYKGMYESPLWISEDKVNASIRDEPQFWATDPVRTLNDVRRFDQDSEEAVYAGYVQANLKIQRLSVLTGVRYERTDFAALTHPSIGGVFQPNRVRRTGGEDKYYPGVHLKYPVTKGLQLRGSWARSTGRPNISDLVASDTFNDANLTIVGATPDLKSQSASNMDVAIEYYFEPVGMLSAAFFHKDISGFIQNTAEILTANNPYGPEYDGYRLTRKVNFGESTVSGYELAYSQQMTFLPGLLKGLGVFANFTSLKATGDRGGTGGVKATLTNFVPKMLNVGASWRYRGFEARVKYNWASDILRGYNVNPAATQWDLDRETVDLNFKYAFSRRYEIYCDIMNATQAHELKYRGDGKVHRVIFDEDVGTRFSLGATIRL